MRKTIKRWKHWESAKDIMEYTEPTEAITLIVRWFPTKKCSEHCVKVCPQNKYSKRKLKKYKKARKW